MACSSWATTVMVGNSFRQSGEGQMMPSGVTFSMEGIRPSKVNACLQQRHFKVSRAESLNRTESGIWLSSGVISSIGVLVLAVEPIEYFRVSRPRHSARWTASVPGIGAHRRSIGGKICL